MTLATVQDILATWPGWATMELIYGDQTSGQGSGQVIVKNLRDPLWSLHAETKTLLPTQVNKWKAILAGLDNGRSIFLGFDFTGFYPIRYPRGTWPTGGSFSGTTASISAKSGKTITLAGLPAGYSGSIGDFIQVTNSTGSPAKLALLQAAETFVANGGGVTGAFEVRPTVPAWVAAAQAVAVKKAGCHMMIIPGSIQAPRNLNARGPISFDAIQVPIP